MTKVSVIIPCYNRSTTIGKAVVSALAQTIPPSEVIVVDDGSRDDSALAAERFGPPVRVIRQSNAGAAAARNRGLAEATGDWVAFLDSDDEWAPTKLERQAAALSRFSDADLIFCNTRTTREDETLMPSRFDLGGLRGQEEERHGSFARYGRGLFTAMLEQSRVITSAVVVRRGLAGLRFPEHIWGSEDWALWLNLVLRYRFVSVDEILVTMHAGSDNLTGNVPKLMRNDVLVLEELFEDAALSPGEREAVRATLERRRFAAMYLSLRAGDGVASRRQLRALAAGQIGPVKFSRYWVSSLLPRRALRMMYTLADLIGQDRRPAGA